MTFLLGKGQPVAPDPNSQPLTTFWEGTRAAGGTEWQDADVARQRTRQVSSETQGMVEQAFPLLGEQAVLQRLKEKGVVPDVMVALPPDALRYNQRAKDEVLEMAREAAEVEPDKWAGMDLSQEGIEARVTERRAKELKENEAILAMSPMPGLAGFLGTMGAAMMDPVNIGLTAFSGGGGSLLRVMAREAVVNATAEAITLPARFRTAEELDKAAPSIIETLAIGAAGGAILGGAMEGLARGFAYLNTRETIAPVPGIEPVRHAAALDAAEDAIIAGESPIEAVEAVLQPRSEPQEGDTQPGVAEVAPPAREPLVPDPVAPVQPAAIDPFERIAAPASQDEIAAAQAALDEARTADLKQSRPLAAYFKKRGGIDPDSPLGQELKARGVSSKTYVGLFNRKTGAKSLDGLVAREVEDDFPGITEAAGFDEGTIYLDQNGLLELLIDSASGRSHAWLRSRADADAALSAALAAENPNRTISALEQYQGKEKADDGLFIDLDAYTFDDPNGSRIETDFDAWSARRGFDASLTPDERSEVLTELRQRGGDAEYLVERVFERSIKEGSDEAGRGAAAAGTDPASGQGAGIPWDNPGNAGQGRAGAGGDAIASERTAAGEQTLIPGVAPVAPTLTRPAPVRGPQEADSQIGGMFDLANLSMRDMFDDPEGPKAQSFLDSMVVDLKAELETGPVDLDFRDGGEGFVGMTTDEGVPITSLKELVDEIEAYDTLAREIELCRTGGAQ
jgi:hypothetical protein